MYKGYKLFHTMEEVVCKVGDLEVGQMKEFTVGEMKVLLIKDAEGFHAIGPKCSHYGAPLVKGAVCNGHVRCPWHGACFSYKTGDIEDFPGLDSVPKYQVRITGEDVTVAVKKSDTSSKRQKAMASTSSDDSRSFVIVGGGPASVSCAETLRQEGYRGGITIISKEKNIAYDRPKLSKALNLKPEDIALRSQDFYSKYGITYETDSEVLSLDTEGACVKLKDGRAVTYDKLVLATGATPRPCSFIRNHELGNIYTLRTVEDGNMIAEKGKGKNVVIIGTSFIGVEVASALVSKAASVTIVDLVEAPFQLALGKEVGNGVKQLLEEKGIKFYFKNSVDEFIGTCGDISQVRLRDGKLLDAELCVVGIGVTPSTDFLKDSGLKMTERGFVSVCKHMETSCANVYAAGDITHFPLFMMNDEDVNIQHWQMAHQQGRIAALNMLGNKVPIKSVPFFWTVIFGKSIRYCGYGVGYDDIVIHGDVDKLKFVAFYTKEDKVIAVASLNYDPIVAQAAEMFLSEQPFTKQDVQKSATAWAQNLPKFTVTVIRN